MKPNTPNETSLKVNSKSEAVEHAPHRWSVEHVGDHAHVHEGHEHRAEHHAPDRAQAAHDDHGEDEDGEAELELVGVDALQEGAEEGARDPAEGAAGGVGQQLGAHQRHAHAGRRHLVLAQGDPRAAQARVAQAEVHEQHHQAQGEHGPEIRSEVRRLIELGKEGQVDLVDGRDRLTPVGELVVAERGQLVAVLSDPADDLAEGQRHDRDVVAAQAQRGQADQSAGDGTQEDRPDDQQQEVQVDAGQALGELADPDVNAGRVATFVDAREEIGGPPAGDQQPERVEGHEAEVQQAGEPHHQVEPERHHHVGESQDGVVHQRVQRIDEEGEQRGGQDHRARPARSSRVWTRRSSRSALIPPPSSPRRSAPAAGRPSRRSGRRRRRPGSTRGPWAGRPGTRPGCRRCPAPSR